jgi:chromosome partitioning protein
VDTAGSGNRAAAVAIAAADLVLVPVTPAEVARVEAQSTVAHANGMRGSTRRTIEVRVVTIRIRRATTLSRHVLAEIDKLELLRMQTTMSEAVAFANSSIGCLIAHLRLGSPRWSGTERHVDRGDTSSCGVDPTCGFGRCNRSL